MSPLFFCEDAWHRAVIKKAGDSFSRGGEWLAVAGGGKSKILAKLREYNRSAKKLSVCILADLNGGGVDCAPAHKKDLLAPLGGGINSGFRLVVAVREAEAWLLADRENFAAYFGVAMSKIPLRAEEIPDPKQCLAYFWRTVAALARA